MLFGSAKGSPQYDEGYVAYLAHAAAVAASWSTEKIRPGLSWKITTNSSGIIVRHRVGIPV